jgi:uncharacterized protein YacL
MVDLILMDTCASADGITIPFFSLAIQDYTIIYRRTVVREIVRLGEALAPADRQRGQQAALTLATLHTLPRLRVILDLDEPLATHTDDDLVLCGKATNAMVYTADVKLQQRAEEEGVAVLRVQDLYRRFRTMMSTLQELFPPLRELANGEMVTIRVHKRGRHEGEGVGVLADGRQIVINGGAEYVGTEVSARVTRVQQTTIGQMVFAADPRPTADVSQADALRAADSTVIPLKKHARS